MACNAFRRGFGNIKMESVAILKSEGDNLYDSLLLETFLPRSPIYDFARPETWFQKGELEGISYIRICSYAIDRQAD